MNPKLFLFSVILFKGLAWLISNRIPGLALSNQSSYPFPPTLVFSPIDTKNLSSQPLDCKQFIFFVTSRKTHVTLQKLADRET